MKSPWIAAVVVIAVSAYAGVSHAFPEHREWTVPASGGSGAKGRRPGGEGVFYTGGAVDAGLKCSVCHVDNKRQQGKVRVDLVAVPVWQVKAGKPAYKPGQTYDLTVRLLGEHLGDGTDNNGVNVSIETPDGATAGIYEADVGGRSDSELCAMAGAPNPLTSDAATNQTTAILGDCRAVLSVAHGKNEKARSSWHFRWTAPAKATGSVTIFLAAVDGNKASSSSLDDDVIEGKVVIAEGN